MGTWLFLQHECRCFKNVASNFRFACDENWSNKSVWECDLCFAMDVMKMGAGRPQDTSGWDREKEGLSSALSAWQQGRHAPPAPLCAAANCQTGICPQRWRAHLSTCTTGFPPLCSTGRSTNRFTPEGWLRVPGMHVQIQQVGMALLT